MSAAVRAAKAAGSYKPPLDGKLIHIQCQANPAAAAAAAGVAGAGGGGGDGDGADGKAATQGGDAAGAGAGAGSGGGGAASVFASHSAAADHRQSLQRLVRALGGRVCGPRAANVCVVCAGASVPRELPTEAVAVREEWLLSVAETHSGVEQTGEWEVPRGRR